MLPSGEYESAKQSTQAPGPDPALYVPPVHCEHVPPFPPVYPALHSQAVFVILPAGEAEFDRQSEQVAGPNPSLYWLILHCKHVLPFDPMYPALH